MKPPEAAMEKGNFEILLGSIGNGHFQLCIYNVEHADKTNYVTCGV